MTESFGAVTEIWSRFCMNLRARVYVTTSGLFTLPPFEVALAVFGIDCVLFSIDYPYSSDRQGRAFLDGLKLPTGDLEKIAYGNADRLLILLWHSRPNASLLQQTGTSSESSLWVGMI